MPDDSEARRQGETEHPPEEAKGSPRRGAEGDGGAAHRTGHVQANVNQQVDPPA
jgi:hypothetical protein